MPSPNVIKMKRVNLYLSEDLINRLKEVSKRFPGLCDAKIMRNGVTKEVKRLEEK